MAAKFDYSLDYKNLDFGKSNFISRVDLGEQGVPMVEPYHTEIIGSWTFKNTGNCQVFGENLYKMFF